MPKQVGVILLCLLQPLAAPGEPAARTVLAPQCRDTLERATTADGPGAAVLVTRSGEVLFRDARGMANIELGVRLSADDVFRIASVTKMFTATMVLKLADEHRITLDDAIGEYLPEFHDRPITVRELLGHTGGISAEPVHPTPGFSRQEQTMASLVAGIAARPPAFPPGTRWAYSNAGFILLGAIIEKITREPWYEAIDESLLSPLGLTHTGYGAARRIIPLRVEGYVEDEASGATTNAPYVDMSIPASAGALVSSVDDLQRWMRALATGRLVSPERFREMTTPGPNLPGVHPGYQYGLGTYLFTVHGTRVIGHTGEINGFTSALMYIPSHDVIVVVLANSEDFDAQTVARRLVAIALGEPYPVATPTNVPAPRLAAIAGVYQANDSTETLLMKGGTLYARRSHHHAVPLAFTSGGQLHFVPDELTYFVPVYQHGQVIALDCFERGDGPAQRFPRIGTKTP